MLKNTSALNAMLPELLQGDYRTFVFVHRESEGLNLHIYCGPELQNINESYFDKCAFIGGIHRADADRMTIIKSSVVAPVRETSTHSGMTIAHECMEHSKSSAIMDFGFNEPVLFEHASKYHFNLTGRRANNDFFSMCPSFQEKDNPHYPFLVFEIESKQAEVHIIQNPRQLLSYPKDTQVMVQWQGKWESNFFNFKVGELTDWMCENHIDDSKLGTSNFAVGLKWNT